METEYLKSTDISARAWKRLTKHFGSKKITYDQLADLTMNQIKDMDGFGLKSFYDLQAAMKKKGYPDYKFRFWT